MLFVSQAEGGWECRTCSIRFPPRCHPKLFEGAAPALCRLAAAAELVERCASIIKGDRSALMDRERDGLDLFAPCTSGDGHLARVKAHMSLLDADGREGAERGEV